MMAPSRICSSLRWLPLGATLLALSAGIGCSSGKPQPNKVSPPVSLRPVWTSPALAGVTTLWGGSFSPDGSRVVVALQVGEEGENEQYQLWVVGQDTKTCLSRGPIALYPDWNPGSQEVVYLDETERRRWQQEHKADWGQGRVAHEPAPKLTIVDAKTGASRVLGVPSADCGPPRWSPDGSTISLTALLPYAEGKEVLLLVDAGNGRVRPVPPIGGIRLIELPPAWSADNQSVLMLGYGSTEGPQQALWMADLRTQSVRCVWTSRGLTGVLAIGFDRASGDPCYVPCTSGPPPDRLRESATLFRYDTEDNQAVEIAQVYAEPEWEIEIPTLSPDGNGLAAVSFGPEPKAGAEVPNDVLLWCRDGRTGREELPSGVDGLVLAWSRDGRRIAISEWDGKQTKIVVYEFSR